MTGAASAPLPGAGSARCVGVDGAKRGWIAVWPEQTAFGFAVYDSPASLWHAHSGASVMAVDIPIGLSERGPRVPDVLARKFVGGQRACSVFSAPVRGILDAGSQAEASRRHREIDERGFGAQAFGILKKIRVWDEFLRADRAAMAVVREVHPEVSFAALNAGLGLAAGKKTPEGAAQRIKLLCAAFGEEPMAALLARIPKRAAAPDDVLDALVALWSAQRIDSGEAKTLPDPTATDSEGVPMAIHY